MSIEELKERLNQMKKEWLNKEVQGVFSKTFVNGYYEALCDVLELTGKIKEEMPKTLEEIDRKETEAFIKELFPAVKKDFDKGFYSNPDTIIKLCIEAFRYGLSKGIKLGMPE